MTPVNPRPDDLPAPDRPAGCVAFVALVNAVLDRELGPDALDGDHPAGCPDCRALATAARQFHGVSLPHAEPRPELAARIVSAAARDRRFRQRRRFVGAALAASLLVAATAYFLRPPTGPREVVKAPPTPAVTPEAPPRVSDRLAEAGSAVMAMTLRARDQTVNPTRTLLPPPEAVTVPTAGAIPEIEPAAESLAGMPDAARSGFEPVTDKTRRAVNLFLRDVGLGSQARPKL
jgi:hypothetical protein